MINPLYAWLRYAAPPFPQLEPFNNWYPQRTFGAIWNYCTYRVLELVFLIAGFV